METKNWYNTKEGIAEKIKTLQGIIELFNARREAHDKKVPLVEFQILGNWTLDTCGNCMRVMYVDVKKRLPNIPDVMTRKEFWAYIEVNDEQLKNNGISMSGSPIPNSDKIVCPVCNKGWTIENFYDMIMLGGTSDHQIIPLTDFIGKPLSEVKAYYAQRIDAEMTMTQFEVVIVNEKYIDMRPDPKHEEWNKQKDGDPIVINERGWLKPSEAGDDYIVKEGDKGWFNVWTYYHRECHKRKRDMKELEQFSRIFFKAGFIDASFTPIENQYEGCRDPECTTCASWFKVDIGTGAPITIGWRKRVIEIDWSVWNVKLDALFQTENVTGGSRMIHAWGEEKAIDYLSRIKKKLDIDKEFKETVEQSKQQPYEKVTGVWLQTSSVTFEV